MGEKPKAVSHPSAPPTRNISTTMASCKPRRLQRVTGPARLVKGETYRVRPLCVCTAWATCTREPARRSNYNKKCTCIGTRSYNHSGVSFVRSACTWDQHFLLQ